jgi:hypothetical protein
MVFGLDSEVARALRHAVLSDAAAGERHPVGSDSE